MQFLILRGHTRLIPQSGPAEFPDAILNGKRLDLYNLYKEVGFSQNLGSAFLCSNLRGTPSMVTVKSLVLKSWGVFRWLPEVAFMLVMASTGKDRSSRRCAITP